MKLTKIIATFGPSAEKTFLPFLDSGIDLVRFNLKHGNIRWHRFWVRRIKKIRREKKKTLGIILDIPDINKSKKLFPQYLSFAKDSQSEFLALSFVRNGKEVKWWKQEMARRNIYSKIISKIESKEAVKNFPDILEHSDAIMIARGDLAKEIKMEKVPYYQKLMIKKCIEKGKPAVVATEMLRSMVSSKFPTRAEISDVANSVLDGADALMLSEETAIGKHPLESIATMIRIASFWEKEAMPIGEATLEFTHQTSAICYSAYQFWQSHYKEPPPIKAFIVLTNKGLTAHMLSRLRPKIPILAFTADRRLKERLSLLFGVYPALLNEGGYFYKKRGIDNIKSILLRAKDEMGLEKGERSILIYSEDWGSLGRTTILRIQEIP